MANVLEKIVEDKRVEIAARKTAMPLSTFIDDLTPSTRSLYQALAQPEAGFILECKKASPSKGLIRETFDLDEILNAYGPYASAISVLTDEKYFQGKFEYLEYVTSNAQQPVLNKDFFVDPYQIHLARKYNADAVLLMLSVLSDAEYRELAELAHHYQLDVLTEVSNEQEAQRAIQLGAKIVGINNRNLRDLSTSLETTENLVPLFNTPECADRLIISESGIYTNQDVRRLAPIVDGFLVGSSLMAQQDLVLAVQQLLYGKLKVCGITQKEDAEMAKSLGATYLGLIFVPSSKRYINQDEAFSITKEITHNYVGVFSDALIEDVAATAVQLELAAVQLHGNEDQHYIDQLRQKLPEDCEIWKAKGVADKLPELTEKHVDHFLLDCKIGEQSGGTGQQFDWRLLAAIGQKDKLILAGGLKPSNLLQAIETGVPILDINSGIESSPGHKSPEKTKEAFDVLRHY